MNDDTFTPKEQIDMMVLRDALEGEVERWELDRNKHWVRIRETDKELVKEDPDRLKKVQHLQKQIALLSDNDHVLEEDDNKARDELIADELPRKQAEFLKLMEDGDSHLWAKRLREFELVAHCNEEIVRCRTEAERLDALIDKPKAMTGLFNYWTRENLHQSIEEVAASDPTFFDDFRTSEEVQIEELEWQNDALEERLEWAEMSAEREVRKKTEEIQRTKIRNLDEYLDQLEGLDQEINEKWREAVGGLDKQNIVEGTTIDVYFEGWKQKQTLALRYRQNLAGTSKWAMTVKNRVGANVYKLEREGKTYLAALGLSEKNHIFCFTFMSKTAAWHDAYMELNGPANLRQMTAYELYEWHDRVEKYLQDKRKGKFDGEKIIQ